MPKDELNELLTKAKELLKNTRISVREICQQVGYRDLKHFNTVFHFSSSLFYCFINFLKFLEPCFKPFDITFAGCEHFHVNISVFSVTDSFQEYHIHCTIYSTANAQSKPKLFSYDANDASDESFSTHKRCVISVTCVTVSEKTLDFLFFDLCSKVFNTWEKERKKRK